MNFLTRILAVDVPENTTLQSAELSFRGLSMLWLIVLFLIVFAGMAGVVLFYLLEKGTLGWIRRVILIGLRCALLFVLLFLILRPVLLAEFEGQRPQGVALLIDASQSMQIRDHRLTDADKNRLTIARGSTPLAKDALTYPPRTELVKYVLTNPELKLVPQLQQFGPMRPYYFGRDLQGVPEESKEKKPLADKILAGYSAVDSETALADSIMKILQAKDHNDLPSAIVVMTDGQDNASKYTLLEAAQECSRLAVPLHIYGVGSIEGAELQLKEVAAPETAFAEDTVAIPLRWRAQGFKDGTANIKLKLGGKDIDYTLVIGGKVVDRNKKLPLQNGDDLRAVLAFVVPKDLDKVDSTDPKKREMHNLTASIEYKAGGEVFKDTLTQTIRVIDSKIRVLYVEHSPRWEFKFLQPMMVRDRRLDAEFILVNAAPEVAKGGKPYLPEFPRDHKEFFDKKYHLLMIGDVAASYFSKEQQEWIREFVNNGGGLIVLAGRQNMPNSYDRSDKFDKEKSPIAEMLPVEFVKHKFALDVEARAQEYLPTLTDAGRRADWLALDDTPEENLEVWQKKLLGFYWYFPVTKLRPAATPLIVNPRAKMGDQPMPILATAPFGKGQVIWMGTDETWRWRWNYQDKYFVRFWGQMLYQAGLPSLLGEGTKRTQMALDRSQAFVGKASKIFVTLRDDKYHPRKDVKVEAELVYLDAKEGEDRRIPVTLDQVKGEPGKYSVVRFHDRPGRYELHVRNPELNTYSFRVDLPPRHELQEKGLAEKALRDAAAVSGGRFYREEDLHQLPDNLEVRKVSFKRRQEVLLWNPLALMLFLGLITAEWLVRKFSDLS